MTEEGMEQLRTTLLGLMGVVVACVLGLAVGICLGTLLVTLVRFVLE